MHSRSSLLFTVMPSALAMLFLCADSLHSQTAAFDLAGPRVDVRVHHEEKSLPVAQVPYLQAGDRLWIHPDLPETQSVRYLVIVAFLRGATNPPPDTWFTKAEAWDKTVREEGIFVTVPQGAEEALVFLAPDTGGGFNTLRGTVRAKPGTFVRASQDLRQASLDRIRLHKYLAAVRELSGSAPSELHSRTVLLARSLGIQLEQYCFDKPLAQQVPCLTQNTDQLVLDDSHTRTMASAITSDSSAQLISQISSTPLAGAGLYNSYIGVIVDVGRLLAAAHTAQYQYIPALGMPDHDVLGLRLNSPPSFRNPKSVLVVSLPPVRPLPVPPLRAVAPQQALCVAQPEIVLPLEGAPLVFATELAHDFSLRVQTKSSSPVELPAAADAARGGFVADTRALQSLDLDPEPSGVLHGFWGFQSFDGPRFRLRSPRPAKWTVASKDASALIVGREDTLHLQSSDASCVEEVTVRDQQGRNLASTWTIHPANELQVKIPLEDSAAGWVKVMIRKSGTLKADEIMLNTYAEASRLSSFLLHAGDAEGVLKGTRLDEVSGLDAADVHFKPAGLSRIHQEDVLKLMSDNPKAKSEFQPGDKTSAKVTLRDGRTLEFPVVVDIPRPHLALMNKSVQTDPAAGSAAFQFGNPDDLPQDAKLNFSLKVEVSSAFATTGKIEVATSDESFRDLLSVADGNLMMQDARTVLATLDPMKHLGPSAFGQLKFRGIDGAENFGDWQPLANLVRVPALKEVRCVKVPEPSCWLDGEKLFLIDSISSESEFTSGTPVPDGFVGSRLQVPFTKSGALYVKLRDDPSFVGKITVPTSTH